MVGISIVGEVGTAGAASIVGISIVGAASTTGSEATASCAMISLTPCFNVDSKSSSNVNTLFSLTISNGIFSVVPSTTAGDSTGVSTV